MEPAEKAYRVRLSAARTLCSCSSTSAFLLFSSESMQLEVSNLFSFSMLRWCSFLIALSGSVFVASLPVVCGLTSGCCRDDLISVRICWSYSLMWHYKSAAVDKHISFSPFCFVLFYLSTERRKMMLNVEGKLKKPTLSLYLAVFTLTLPLCRRRQQSSSHNSRYLYVGGGGYSLSQLPLGKKWEDCAYHCSPQPLQTCMPPALINQHLP